MKKLAPSNAAARLLGGDTIHALCKLPFGNARLSSKRGRLTKAALQLHRRQWASTIAAYIDEISMISGDQFCQVDVRCRQAKMNFNRAFGALAINIGGDFLQLPPVDKNGSRLSLALPLNDTGKTVGQDIGEAEAKTAAAESRQGRALWSSIRKVVCLTINVRAPDILSRL